MRLCCDFAGRCTSSSTRSLHQKNGERLPDAALQLRYRCATGPLPPRVRGSPFLLVSAPLPAPLPAPLFSASAYMLVRYIQRGAPKAFGAYNRLLRSTNHFISLFRQFEGEVVSNNIVAKARNTLHMCELKVIPGL